MRSQLLVEWFSFAVAMEFKPIENHSFHADEIIGVVNRLGFGFHRIENTPSSFRYSFEIYASHFSETMLVDFDYGE